MRKAIVAVLVTGLMAVSAPAMAQITPGSLDPLGLVTSGLVIPYVGAGANQSWLEIAAPVTNVTFHAFFYDQTCVRAGDSIGIALTTNDVELLRLDNLGGNIPTTGLLTGAGVDGSGFVLAPLGPLQALHSRVYWADTAHNRIRVLEPIALSTLDNDLNTGFTVPPASGVWNPLRTGATFFAPLEGSTFATTLYFICPTQNIAGTATQTSSTTRAFGNSFPLLIPPAVASGTTPLRVRVYDDEENFLRDVFATCSCLTISPVTTISSVYADAANAPFGTYTEVEGSTTNGTGAVCSTTQTVTLVTPGAKNSGNPCDFVTTPLSPGCSGPADTSLCTSQFALVTAGTPAGGPFAFTGYKAIDTGSFDAFGRLSNGNKCDIQGNTNAACTAPSPNRR